MVCARRCCAGWADPALRPRCSRGRTALRGALLFELLDAAQEMACACDPAVPVEENPGAWLGAAIGEAARAGRDKLTIVLHEAIASFGDWVEQLIAESTGKEGMGILPVVGEDIGMR